ncbi:MAG: 16S rRNA (cytosine(1402)-N(4))-methyltransferase [Candidatus Sungbacteria bacterium RIFCSPHIGHO2_01_FULL_50_25]|uniref:Ribosomal RNA small subunit methyltransferase H n=1 Tax=Candidatus Sungbacteria bacterium RIFCSPHIGHO2_01_FULL_50_25 TaxID=1802265 RepID=A0A1G2K715_9BACT|nr:MAG: 16S rRNA (cytosine(1402)-N(4))-methyltransferase [Candidatus Sungbacteria bacterium RIFCSPHIGHO2_01_FULL_50_25]
MHKSVLLKETLEILDPQPGGIFIDATVNGGGHARAILERVGGKGTVIGIDWDKDLVEMLRSEAAQKEYKNFHVIYGNYKDIETVIPKKIIGTVDGVLFDFGYSSYHIERAGRGFSFQKNEPLDMRYDNHGANTTAKTIVNTWPQDSIADILRACGEERYAREIARAIVQGRKEKEIATTYELVSIIERVFRGRSRGRNIHPATRTFQALRIAVNEEFENIAEGLAGAFRIVRIGGIVAAVSFHSLEDRIVKTFFRERAQKGEVELVNKKPIVPTQNEIQMNRRARSAKLRAARKINISL